MKHKNNLSYYILKAYEIEEKNQKVNSSLVSKYDLYNQSLKILESVCEKFKINTPEKLAVLISNLEKEILSKEKSDEKNAKIIGSVVALMGAPSISLLFDLAKTDANFLILVVLFLTEIVFVFYAAWQIFDEINAHFSLNFQYKKLLRMLSDLKLLHYLEERKIDER